MKKTLLFSFFFLVLSYSFANDVVPIARKHFGIDHNLKLIVVNYTPYSIHQNSTDPIEALDLEDEGLFTFSTIQAQLSFGLAYTAVNNANTPYSIYFTELPIINLTVQNTIVDAPKVLGLFELCDTLGNYTSTLMGIEYRGGYSQTLSKKSYEVEFWLDSLGEDSQDMSLLGLVNTDSYNLQALFTEPSRINSVTLFDLWNKIDTLHYVAQEPQAINGIRMKYVEIFLNNTYKGFYALGEKVNRKQLRLKKYDNEILGELYKGDQWGVTRMYQITVAPDNTSDYWDGFEYKHPKDLIDWSNLHDFIYDVIHLTPSAFNEMYKEKFDVKNAANYFIFLNLTRALDNTGKNLYLAKYTKNTPYFFVPWDLDGTLGYLWDGTQGNIYNDILKNNLLERMLLDCDTNENTFPTIVKNRWSFLRQDVLQLSNIHDMIDTNYQFLSKNAMYVKDELAWPEYSFDPSIIDYMKEWVSNRIAFLDEYFDNLCKDISVIENDVFAGIRVAPNPFNSYISLTFPANHQIKEAAIYSMDGKLIEKQASNGKSMLEFSMSGYPNAVYIVRLTDASGHSKSIKLIKY